MDVEVGNIQMPLAVDGCMVHGVFVLIRHGPIGWLRYTLLIMLW